jgi:uncharacterized protein YjbJ (UPF0337 family)
MVNVQTLQGNWNELKGKIRQKWGQLSDDDLQMFQGNVDQLVGTIQRKTGENRDKIEQYLDELSSGAASTTSRIGEAVRDTMGRVGESARGYAQQATESVQGASRQVAESVRSGYENAGEMVRQHPTQSLAVAFGAGLITGVVIGFMIRSD